MKENDDQAFMRKAIALAEGAAANAEVPVGAVLVREDQIIGEGANATISACDPSGHAEIVALRSAAKAEGNYRLPGTTLYVTIEPCAMCLGVVFGAKEPKAGVLVSNRGLLDDNCLNHSFEVTEGVLEEECSELMSSFFKERRALKARLKQSSPKAP